MRLKKYSRKNIFYIIATAIYFVKSILVRRQKLFLTQHLIEASNRLSIEKQNEQVLKI
jgi:hypothetical protein